MLGVGLAPTARGEEPPLIIAADEWCPYNCALTAEQPGYLVELAALAWQTADQRVEYRVIPWSRCLQEVRRGGLQAVIGITRREARQLVLPELALGISAQAVAVRADSNLRLTSTDRLDGLRVGVTQDYDYGPDLSAYLRQRIGMTDRLSIAHGERPLEQNLRMLEHGRVDAVLEDVNVLSWTLSRGRWGGVRLAPGTIGHEAVYIALSPHHPRARELANRLDATVRRLQANGQLAVLLARYGLTTTTVGLAVAN